MLWSNIKPEMQLGDWWLLQFAQGDRYTTCQVIEWEGQLRFCEINTGGIVSDTPEKYLPLPPDKDYI